MTTPPPAIVSQLHAQCFDAYASYSVAYHDMSPVWIGNDDEIHRTWNGTVECDGKRIIFERWDETHPRKRRPYEAAMQIGCHLLVLPMIIISPSSLSAGGACRDLNGDNEGEATYAR